MYKLHLILKYLRKRRIAWVSLIAVMLCTAMVIVVISVMGGWLSMFKQSFHDLTGDIVISRRSLSGFPKYEQIIERIKQLPEVEGAAPTLKTFGLVNINNMIRDGVQVIGLPLEKMNGVTFFRKSLHRQYQLPLKYLGDKRATEQDREVIRQLLGAPASFEKPLGAEFYKGQFPDAKTDVSNWPGMIVGTGVVGIGKDEKGSIRRPPDDVLLGSWVRLTVLGMNEGSVSVDVNDRVERAYWIVDDSRTGAWQYDSQTIYVPFEVLQKDLRMEAQPYTDAATGQQMIEPARTHDIRVGLKAGADLQAARDKVQAIVEDVLGKQSPNDGVRVQTWLVFNADYIAAIENEKVLVVVLFGIISIVAIFLIFCIFYMIVVEKTKDIGIVKSVGATSGGVAGIFLGYGLAIGLVGSGLGLLAGFLIVHNINFLHAQLAKLMGIQIWNPKTYIFDTIPNTIDPKEVSIIMTIAIVASVLGALVPAWRAARLHPVEALSLGMKMAQLATTSSTPVRSDTVILRASSVKKTFRMGDSEVHVLKGADLSVRAGEFVAIEGRSGSGKSTLLHILGALDEPESGSIIYDNQDIATLSSGAKSGLRNTQFGFVFQFYHLLPELNVLENTLLAAMIEHSWLSFRAKRAELRRKGAEVLEHLGMSHRLKHRPNQLSGGERQRVAIARALMNNPRVLFADEPTGNLDLETGRQIMTVLENLHRTKNQTIVMVTHDRTIARQADRILVLKDGKLERAERSET